MFFFAPNLREEPFHVMFVRNQHRGEQNELIMCEFESQDATKIMSASADSRINFSWVIMSFWVRPWCLCLVLLTIFLNVFLLSPSLVTMSSSPPSGVHRVNIWTRKAAEHRRENYYNDSLAFSRYNIYLVFDEENMKPERLTKAPENAGIDPGTMRVK